MDAEEDTSLTINAAIESGDTGRWYGRLIGLLGTYAKSDSKEGLLKELVEELDYHLDWLNRHGETERVPRNRSLQVAEEVGGIRGLGESGGEVALFGFDRTPVDSRLLEKGIRYMHHSRDDLMMTVQGLDDGTMDRVPSGKRRSIRDILSHVCNAEEFYLSRLGPEADGIYEGHLGMPVSRCDELPILERLPVVRSGCVQTLRELVPQKKGLVFQRAEYTAHPEEKWTAYKVMRRYLEHEREHIYNIREYLGYRPRGTGTSKDPGR